MGLAFYMVFRAFKKDNLIAVLYWMTLIFLVIGQAVHISLALSCTNRVTYLYNEITAEGHLLASIMVAVIVLMVSLLERIFVRKKTIYPDSQKQFKIKLLDKYFGLYYLAITILFLLITAVLIKTIGGGAAWLYTDRPAAPGSTFLVLLLGIGAYPLLIKMVSKCRINICDRLLFVVSTGLILSFSRFLALFNILLLIVSYIYSVQREKPLSLKRYKWLFLAIGILLISMQFLYGSFRQFSYLLRDYNIIEVANIVAQNPEKSLLSVDMNYRFNIEGMSSFSAVISKFMDTGKFQADYGISLLQVIEKMFPSWSREITGTVWENVRSFYWYQDSIVGGGLEGFFVHFSFWGLLLYPFIYFWLAYGIHSKLLSSNNQAKSLIDSNSLLLIVFAVFGLQIVRGSTLFLVLFTTSEIMIMYLSVYLLRLFHKIVKKEI